MILFSGSSAYSKSTNYFILKEKGDTSAKMCILGIINSFGTIAIVTKGYSSILANFSYVYAIAQATQIVVGYLLGAKRISDLEKRVWGTL
jgi:Na+-driven multidrug efflux pump